MRASASVRAAGSAAGCRAASLLLIGLTVAAGSAAVLDAAARRSPSPTSRSRRCCATASSSTTPSCITCHGANLQGVPDRGPSLIGVGEAAVYFQVSTGRMPLARQEAQAPRKRPELRRPEADRRARRLRPGQRRRPDGRARADGRSRSDRCAATTRPRRRPVPAQLRLLPQLHRQGRRAVVGQVRARPRTRPPSSRSTRAMLTGPQNMPKFSDRQLSPDEKKDIIGYVKSVDRRHNDPGGYGLGGFGPAPEGLVAFIVGMGWSVAHLWIGLIASCRLGARVMSACAARPATPTAVPHDGRGHDAGRATRGWPRRRARRRRARLQASRVAGRGHPGREARRAVGRDVVRCLRAGRTGVVGWRSCSGPGSTSRRPTAATRVRAGHPARRLTFGLSILSLGIGVVPTCEEVLPGRDLDPGAPRRHVRRDRPPDRGRQARSRRQGHRHRAGAADQAVAGAGGGRARPRHPCVAAVPGWLRTRGRAATTPRCG